MLAARSILPFILLMLLHTSIYSQEKPATFSDSLSLQQKDTDGDGVDDLTDKCINAKGPASNYGCPAVDSTRVIKVYSCGPNAVFFAKGNASLPPAAIKWLNEVVKILNDNPGFYIGLSGYTNNVGNYDLNMRLAMARVEAVRSYFVSAGIDKNRITYSVYGSKYPSYDNRTSEGRAKNRRVEIELVKY